MKRLLLIMLMSMSIMATSCSKDDSQPSTDIENPTENPTDKPQQEVSTAYNEPFCPQIHFTPSRNWMNDPNGMVYSSGVYHLYYQYSTHGNEWGNMSWGHAESKDLIHWEEKSVAMTRDALGDVFSGSAVVDKDNTAGFGAGALIALFTSADGIQQQSLAYSLDGGETFERFSANPVIKYNDDNLRDPKVFWHEASQKWIMVLAKGWAKGVEFYSSTDLKSWSHLSTFVTDLSGRPSLQWECPDFGGVRFQRRGFDVDDQPCFP